VPACARCAAAAQHSGVPTRGKGGGVGGPARLGKAARACTRERRRRSYADDTRECPRRDAVWGGWRRAGHAHRLLAVTSARPSAVALVEGPAANAEPEWLCSAAGSSAAEEPKQPARMRRRAHIPVTAARRRRQRNVAGRGASVAAARVLVRVRPVPAGRACWSASTRSRQPGASRSAERAVSFIILTSS